MLGNYDLSLYIYHALVSTFIRKQTHPFLDIWLLFFFWVSEIRGVHRSHRAQNRKLGLSHPKAKCISVGESESTSALIIVICFPSSTSGPDLHQDLFKLCLACCYSQYYLYYCPWYGSCCVDAIAFNSVLTMLPNKPPNTAPAVMPQLPSNIVPAVPPCTVSIAFPQI